MSFSLDSDNEFAVIGSFLNNEKLTNNQIQERKFLYIEGLIRFLEIYAQNEIGNVEVDIEKIALWVNSPAFENVDIYKITSIDKVYEMLTTDIIDKNVPLYRFLKLSKYQLDLLEKEHYNIILNDFLIDSKKYPCLKCIWYENDETSFGTLSKCNCPISDLTNNFTNTRRGFLDITDKKQTKCKFITTVDNKELFIKKYITDNKNLNSRSFIVKDIMISINKYLDIWNNKIKNLDNSYIPINIPTDLTVDLSEKMILLKILVEYLIIKNLKKK